MTQAKYWQGDINYPNVSVVWRFLYWKIYTYSIFRVSEYRNIWGTNDNSAHEITLLCVTLTKLDQYYIGLRISFRKWNTMEKIANLFTENTTSATDNDN